MLVLSLILVFILLFLLWRCDPTRVMASSFLRFLDHTQRRITFGRTPLDEWSARRRDFYLTKHNTDNRQTSMPTVEFEPTISAARAAADLRLTPRGYWDQLLYCLAYLMISFILTLFKFWAFKFEHCVEHRYDVPKETYISATGGWWRTNWSSNTLTAISISKRKI